MFELSFYQNVNGRRHKLIPVEISENISDKVIDLLLIKKHYALLENLHVRLGNHDSKRKCTSCSSSFSCQNTL